jgi:hypothetical protein
MAQRRGVGGRLLTRNGNDWTDRYPSVVAAMQALKVNSCLIDGEITVCDERGVPVFDRLRHGRRARPLRMCNATQRGAADGTFSASAFGGQPTRRDRLLAWSWSKMTHNGPRLGCQFALHQKTV